LVETGAGIMAPSFSALMFTGKLKIYLIEGKELAIIA
jgi:hypothetical protein